MSLARVTSIDPAAGMLQVAAGFLQGKAFPKLRQIPPPPEPSSLLSWLWHREVLPAIDPQAAAEEDAEAVARWMVACYPRRRYPAVAVGGINGALVHLCAALGIPWLPQSFAVPARRQPRSSAGSGELAPRSGWRKVTRHGLGAAWSGFLTRCLPVGSTILVVESAGGPAEPLEPSFLEDLQGFARRRGLTVVRVGCRRSEDLSPLVADLYAWWYRRRGIVARRLFASSFIVSDPLWTLRVGAVPFWLDFVTEPSAIGLERYLEARPAFDYINLCLFQPGGVSVELPPVERWQGILARAKRRGDGVGVDAASYPADLASFARYQDTIRRVIPRYPLSPSLPLADFGGFLRHADRYRVSVQPLDGAVRWLE